jgi:uncharacterized protein (DUF2236 family)
MNPVASETTYFVPPGSVLRRIWGDADVILLIFAGSAAEFALNKAVDWLFFTGKLPADPIGRMFSTVTYAQNLIFQPDDAARRTIGQIAAIHKGVEASRQAQIPDWAYRDVLYMLIDYAERAYTLLHCPLTADEQAEMYALTRQIGTGMGVPGVPETYAEFVIDRAYHLDNDLVRSEFTDKLLASYRRQLGGWRYALARQVQALLVPASVRVMLGLPRPPRQPYGIRLYGLLKRLGLRTLVQRLLLPTEHLARIQGLDRAGL